MHNLRTEFRNTLNNTCKGKVLTVPVTTITITDYRKKTGTDFPQAHINSDDMMKLATAPYRFSKIEGANLPFDMTIEAEAFGCDIDLRESTHTPEVKHTPYHRPSDITGIPENFTNTKRMNILFKAIEKIREKYPDLPVLVGITGPFTLLGQLLGIEKLLRYIKTGRFETEEALSITTEALLLFTEKLTQYDIDAICVCEPSASCDLLDPVIFHDMLKPELEYLGDQTEENLILHVCGNSAGIIEDMLTCNYEAISIEDVVDMNYVNQLRKKTNTNTSIAGNISTKALLHQNTGTIKKLVQEALDKKVDILTSSCSVPPLTPKENVDEMIKARDEYYEKKMRMV